MSTDGGRRGYRSPPDDEEKGGNKMAENEQEQENENDF
jgi:hypothetical protein